MWDLSAMLARNVCIFPRKTIVASYINNNVLLTICKHSQPVKWHQSLFQSNPGCFCINNATRLLSSVDATKPRVNLVLLIVERGIHENGTRRETPG